MKPAGLTVMPRFRVTFVHGGPTNPRWATVALIHMNCYLSTVARAFGPNPVGTAELAYA